MSEPIRWKELTPTQRDRLVAEKLFNWQPVECEGELTIYSDGEAFCYGCKQRDHVSTFEHDIIAHLAYTQSMNCAWQIVEMMVKRMGYDHIGFEWTGPTYKPTHHYFSSCQHDEIHKTGHFDYTQSGGFSLGEPCWWVKYSSSEPPSVLRGRYNWIMTDTPQEAICIAALRIEGVEVLP